MVVLTAHVVWRESRTESFIKHLDSKGNYIVPHRIIRSWYTGRWCVGCNIWYSEEGPGRAAVPPSPLIAVPNVTVHPSTASVSTTVLLYAYDGPLFCGFNVAIKGLSESWPFQQRARLLSAASQLPVEHSIGLDGDNSWTLNQLTGSCFCMKTS